jgi:hypothetical protein
MGQGKERRNKVTTKDEETKNQIDEKNKNWLFHLQRKPSERSPKQFLYYQLKEGRDPGRPRKRYNYHKSGHSPSS